MVADMIRCRWIERYKRKVAGGYSLEIAKGERQQEQYKGQSRRAQWDYGE